MAVLFIQMKKIPKIDKFYIAFAIVFILLSVVVIFTLRTIFDGLNTANSIDPELLEGNAVRIEQAKVEEAVRNIENRKHVPLDLR